MKIADLLTRGADLYNLASKLMRESHRDLMRDLASSQHKTTNHTNKQHAHNRLKNSVIAFVTLNVCFSYYVTHTRQLYETQCNNLRIFSSCRGAF